MNYKVRRSALALATLFALSACATAETHSARSPNYDRMPKKIFAVAALGAGFPEAPLQKNQTHFAEKFRSYLQSCGISADILFVDTTALHLIADEKIKKFDPDSVLYIQWTKATLQQGALIDGIYHLDMRDMIGNVIVWNANVELKTNAYNTAFSYNDILLISIINQMAADKMIPANCLIQDK